MPTLDNTAHYLQWPQKGISVGFDQLHGFVLVRSNTLLIVAALLLRLPHSFALICTYCILIESASAFPFAPPQDVFIWGRLPGKTWQDAMFFAQKLRLLPARP